MKSINVLLIAFLLVLTSGCSHSYNSGQRSSEQVSYLYFSGEAVGVSISIDDGAYFSVTKTGINNLYKVAPGKHIIKIKRNEKIIAERNVLLGNAMEKEINIP